MIIRISCLILCSLLAISAAPGVSEKGRHPVPFLLKGVKNDNHITIHSVKELPAVAEAYFLFPSHLPKEDRLKVLEHLVEQNYVNDDDDARRGGENYVNDNDDADDVEDFDDYDDERPPRRYEDEYEAELEDDDDDEEGIYGSRGDFEYFEDDDDDDDNDDDFEHRISTQTLRVSGGLQGFRKTPVALGRKTLNEDVESGRSNGRRRRNRVRRRRRQRRRSQRHHRRFKKRVRRHRRQRRRKETRLQRLERRRLRRKHRRAVRARRRPRRFVA